MFEWNTEAAPAQAPAASCPAGRFVIAGADMAGVSAAQVLRNCGPQANITLPAGEPRLPYYRLNHTRYLAGEFRPTSSRFSVRAGMRRITLKDVLLFLEALEPSGRV
jgi:hypothetical protein